MKRSFKAQRSNTLPSVSFKPVKGIVGSETPSEKLSLWRNFPKECHQWNCDGFCSRVFKSPVANGEACEVALKGKNTHSADERGAKWI